MLPVDLHVHSMFSRCGLHTVLELCAQAKVIGLKGMAITDHGMTMGGRLTSVFFERFRSPYSELTLLKGIECNVTDNEGSIDLPESFRCFLDLVLLGLHTNTEKGHTKEWYTKLLLDSIEKNSAVDIITHPNDTTYPVDYRLLAEGVVKHGAALELNNSKILYARSDAPAALALLNACKDTGCRIAVNSDTHAIHELGDDGAVAPLLKQCRFPEELIVNCTYKSAMAFIEERRENKSA